MPKRLWQKIIKLYVSIWKVMCLKTKVLIITHLCGHPCEMDEIMKIAKTGIIKKGNASRNLSRITKKINTL